MVRKCLTSDCYFPTLQVYCDMSHSGGGWGRVIHFHHNDNVSCPSFPESHSGAEWSGVMLTNGSMYCLRAGWNGTGTPGDEGRSVTWNSQGNISYSEIRGYVELRLLIFSGEPGQGDGFAGPEINLWEDTFADGLSIEIPIPGSGIRHVYSYILASEERQCPLLQGVQAPPYLMHTENTYVCGHVNSDDPVDENRVYQILPHSPGGGGGCQFCPAGSPWFLKELGERVSSPLRLRFVDHMIQPGVFIAVSDLEIYIR